MATHSGQFREPFATQKALDLPRKHANGPPGPPPATLPRALNVPKPVNAQIVQQGKVDNPILAHDSRELAGRQPIPSPRAFASHVFHPSGAWS
jgi:hypothetical protein